MEGVIQRLLNGPRGVRTAMCMFIDAALVAFVVWLAFVLRLEEHWAGFLYAVPWIFPVAILATIESFRRFGLYRSPLRYASGAMVYRVVSAGTVAAIIVAAAVFMIADGVVPRGALVILWGLLIALPGAVRVIVRDIVRHYSSAKQRVPVAIYGAGNAGHQLATALLQGSRYQPVAFVDDAPGKSGQTISGLTVYTRGHLSTLIEEKGVREVLVAIPAASVARQREVIGLLSRHPVVVRIVPSFEDIAGGRKRVDDLRRIEIADILGREAVSAIPQLLSRAVQGRCVVVTGAGGSIGSELCRVIFKQNPKRLVLVEQNEFALYSISQELEELRAAADSDVDVAPVLASVNDRGRMERMMRSSSAEVVFHAAAYKHVPIVEVNATEGVRNNVFGTLNCALAARDAGVDRFVLVSTDKAVRPTNVMGATKRFAELILQAFADQSVKPKFSMVRFGNVLESSGSVVPLFKRQIAMGGPITVTDREVTRYFMTIPEAARLVVQAGAMSLGGDVFLLDMGEPIRISDLAERMIHLSGLRVRNESDPNGDIEIAYTKMRAGEKLHEELLIGNNAVFTEHPMIQRAQEEKLPWSEVSRLLECLQLACDQHDIEQVRAVLAEAVPGYSSPVPVRLASSSRAPAKLCVIQGGNTNVQGYVLRKAESGGNQVEDVPAEQIVATNARSSSSAAEGQLDAAVILSGGQ
jgi:FlaA1/EpsC-like NDP-sugar epimerase